MALMTITEALAETKLITKKIEKKQAQILSHLMRATHMPDPFEKDGGSREMIVRENQAINDLYDRLVSIREKIATVNSVTKLTVESVERTISWWLAWRRDVQDKHIGLMTSINANANALLKQAEKPQVYQNAEGKQELVKYQLNVDLAIVSASAERLLTIKEKLDGMLSLKNATCTIDL